MEVFKLTLGERFKLGDLATVEVKDITKGQVRFGIDAPRSVAVHRLEIYMKVQAEGLKSSKTVQSPPRPQKDVDANKITKINK